jgi:hypothetical protein
MRIVEGDTGGWTEISEEYITRMGRGKKSGESERVQKLSRDLAWMRGTASFG